VHADTGVIRRQTPEHPTPAIVRLALVRAVEAVRPDADERRPSRPCVQCRENVDRATAPCVPRVARHAPYRHDEERRAPGHVRSIAQLHVASASLGHAMGTAHDARGIARARSRLTLRTEHSSIGTPIADFRGADARAGRSVRSAASLDAKTRGGLPRPVPSRAHRRPGFPGPESSRRRFRQPSRRDSQCVPK
jgi:hypothetical protein